jgi:hypothetical protein
MKMSLRYTLVGLGALATLSLVGWLRQIHFDGGDVASFLIGVLPNVAAAIATPYVLLGIWIEQRPGMSDVMVRRNYTRLALFAGGGLIAWEFLQQSSRRLVFDFNDLGATLVGLLIGWLIFKRLTTQADTTVD